VQPAPAPKPARSDSPARPAAPSSADRPLSTKNGLIAARGQGGIYLIDPAVGNVFKAPDTADLDGPVWSPTGRLLALERVQGGISSVYTINRRGTQRRLIVKDASAPMWSADGQRLFVVRGSCVAPEGCEATADDSVLLSVRPDGTDVRQVDYEDVDASQAGWPVDGNWIAFLEDSGVDVANPTSVDSSAAAWSPDATKLAFASSSGVRPEGAAADEARGLWVIDANGGRPELVAKGSYQSLSWGPAAQPRSSD
jgi:Tol biopolymer transport system component